jgi:hypothetical protein
MFDKLQKRLLLSIASTFHVHVQPGRQASVFRGHLRTRATKPWSYGRLRLALFFPFAASAGVGPASSSFTRFLGAMIR